MMLPVSLREDLDTFIRNRLFLNSFILPDYELFNIKNISSIVRDLFAIKSELNTSFPKDYVADYNGVEKVLLVILDGFGYTRLLSHTQRFNGVFSSFIEKGVSKFLTSPFPATTSTSLTSIFTGLPPSKHGVIGFTTFLKEYGLIFNTLNMRAIYGNTPYIDIAEELSNKLTPWTATLTENGIEVISLTRSSIVGSGLSKIIHKGQRIVPYILQSDMFIQCRKILQKQTPLFLTMYYGGIDSVEHLYGPESEETSREIQLLEGQLKSQLLDKLPEEDKKKTLIIVTADHGVVEATRTYFLKDIPDINDKLLLPPVGDSRATFLFPKYGNVEELKDALKKNIEGFTIISSKTLIEKGALGPTQDINLLKTGLGELAALSTNKNIIAYPHYSEDRKNLMAGAHGGMTPGEIIVPLLTAKLSKL
ncbi:MAG: Alkaline phosphatase family protein [Thermoproteota archaeon]|nr:Alkaline phosphatase family protein [Thermoproteota archaeon]